METSANGTANAVDEFRWLEDLESAAAAEWVRARNDETLAALASGEGFTRQQSEIREVLDAPGRISYPGWRGDGFYYSFWQDATHPRGRWRRTTAEQYRRDDPEWDVLLDVDTLAADEGESWVWEGVTVLRPRYDRCLVSLSKGGADAVVVREYDLVRRAFVTDGFHLPEAKSSVGWIDEDHVYIGTDFGPGSVTSAGYPRIVKRWGRGTALADAEVVFEGQVEDVAVHAWRDPTPGYVRDFVCRTVDFYRSECYLRTADGALVRIPIPDDAGWNVHREWLLVRPRSAWSVGETVYPAGVLLATRLDSFLAGERDLTVLFQPDERTALSYYAWTRNHLILGLLSDVKTRPQVLTPEGDQWRRAPLTAAAAHDATGLVDTDPDRDDSYLLVSEGFLQPATLQLGEIGREPEILKQEPAYFDTANLVVDQHFATSADGTRVPYFVVGDPAAPAGPTLLKGYGGFEVSLTPTYDGVIGRGWLAHGGRYAVANIRGGGEYGPRWHDAALRDQRPRAYEDFAAVAADLVARGFTTPRQLGVEGGSNGGLLTGVMLTRYPSLVGAVVAHVPLLDMRRYHKLLAGASWMAEYGDPDDEQDWAYLREFSPYHNVSAGQSYPPLLLTTSTRDDRVHPGHARKMAALLRSYGHDVTYYENVEGGHAGGADNAQRALITALTLRFLWQRLAGSVPEPAR